jgi:hypothetical protein
LRDDDFDDERRARDEDFLDDDLRDDDFLDGDLREDFLDDDLRDGELLRDDERFLDALFDDFFGTLAPERRASESPIAIACLRLFTFLPERPLFNSPCLRSCIAFFTFDCAFLPYRAMMRSSMFERAVDAERVARQTGWSAARAPMFPPAA